MGSPRSVGARVGRPSRRASAHSRSISSRLLQATPRWPNGPSGGSGWPAPSTSTITKGRVRSVSQTERTPSWTRRCKTMGRDHGWRRVYWHTHDDNLAGRALYDRLTERTDYVRYDIDL